MRSKNTARSGRINIQDRIALFVAETISESAADAQKPPSPQQTLQQQQQPSQQQPPGGIGAGGTGGGDGTPAAAPTSVGNVQQSQQAVPSATPTPTTANPHSAGPPSSNQPSPHPSPLYPVIPQQASQPNGSTQGKRELRVSASRPLCCATEREFACLFRRLSRRCANSRTVARTFVNKNDWTGVLHRISNPVIFIRSD